jgi:hypothetical protein
LELVGRSIVSMFQDISNGAQTEVYAGGFTDPN